MLGPGSSHAPAGNAINLRTGDNDNQKKYQLTLDLSMATMLERNLADTLSCTHRTKSGEILQCLSPKQSKNHHLSK